MARIEQLDVLRGLACLLVLFSHLQAIPFFQQFPDLGVTGVGIFFAISGFLITSQLVEQPDLWRFYNRRVCRILPIYFLTLAGIAVFWRRAEVAWAACFCLNWLFVSGPKPYFQSDAVEAPVGHYWSLCVEEHFYLLWPLLVSICPRRWLQWIPIAVMVGTPFVVSSAELWLDSKGITTPDSRDFLSRWTFTNLVAISLGAWAGLHREWLLGGDLLGQITVPRALTCSLIVLVILGLLVRSDFLPISGYGTVHQLFCGSLFLLTLGIPILRQCWWLADIGKISYGLYLYHLPIYAAFGLIGGKTVGVAAGIYAIAVTFLVSWCSWRLIEQPAIRFGRDALGRRWPGLIISILLGLSAIGMTVWTYAKEAEKNNWVEFNPPNLANEIETSVLGSSHAWGGVCTPELSGVAYNLGTNAQDLWHTCHIAQNVIQHCPKLRRMLIVLTWPVSFDYAKKDRHLRQDTEILTYLRKSKYEQDTSSRCLHLHWRRVRPPDPVPSREMGIYFPDTPVRGWWRHPPGKFDDNGQHVAPWYDTWRSPSFFDENLQRLENLIRQCQAAGIQIDLVTAPVHESFRQYTPEAAAKSFQRGVDLLRSETGIEVVDFTADHRFGEQDFYDSNHLNADGARKFTRILAAEVLTK